MWLWLGAPIYIHFLVWDQLVISKQLQKSEHTEYDVVHNLMASLGYLQRGNTNTQHAVLTKTNTHIQTCLLTPIAPILIR